MDLFGRKKQEEQVGELEHKLSGQKGKEDLAKILEKRDEKIRKLTSAYQESWIPSKRLSKRLLPGAYGIR